MSYGYGQQPSGYGYQQPDQSNGMPPYGANPYASAQMPGFNMSAPVIHMSAPGRPGQNGDRRGGRTDTYEQGNRGRAGLGADTRDLERSRQQTRDNMMAAQPPTREEIARTIFIGGLGEGTPPDHVLELILKSVGKLRRWIRAKDALENRCRFGFAEFEDVDSLEAAKAAFDGGFDVPVYKDDQIVKVEGEGAAPQMMRVLVVIDEQSSKYIDDWMAKRNQTEEARQFRVEGAKEDLRQCIVSLVNDSAFAANATQNGDIPMTDAPHAETVEVQLNLEDELSDIPAEMRAQVAQEIRAFRDRAKRLDVERVKKEDEIKAADLARSNANRPYSRLASPPLAGVNGAPSGPRIAGAPSGPKGYRGAQLPSDYVGGVAFVNGADSLMEDENSDASDLEIEKRKEAEKQREQDKQFADAERRWLNREKQRLAANARERTREEAEEEDLQKKHDQMARRLEKWDDEEEDRLGREDFYVDRARWAQRRAKRRDAERREDDQDRAAEQAELNAGRRHADEVRDAADQFLEQAGAEYAAAKATGASSNNFKVSLGTVNFKRTNTTAKPKRTLAEVAGFLDDAEDAAASGQQRVPRAIAEAELGEMGGADMSESDRAAKRQKLAAEIPLDTASLFDWEVRWSYIEDSLLEREIRPFVSKKVLEYLGVQEDFLVDLVISGLKEQKDARQLVADLEPALEDEAEVLIKKVWRLVVFWAEAESRGLN